MEFAVVKSNASKVFFPMASTWTRAAFRAKFSGALDFNEEHRALIYSMVF
jgi:hypothetical protein